MACTKSDWNAAALDYSAIAVCGCGLPIETGQQLYRLVNFISGLDGGGTQECPPLFINFILPEFASVYYLPGPGINTPRVDIQLSSSPLGVICVLQINNGLSNPLVKFNPIDPINKFYPGDPIYELFYNLPILTSIDACIWGDNYQPLGVIRFVNS
jgi:hypothetical protein